ncbi:Plasmid pRiA4b ORF-3-like protein [Candidatus Omnitrophus magneticus]|uniref:Plasmid pRiA4b ORF-3-like protein n=1 Tax=Candidatus Omnitrophus magneticus TaxID=1609969 RepID=A0A0F0CSI7_9BACT|nr:Plasmid pRiA4b ORF-3-like protein [Candidatus Omnitrophus magneticus]
MVEPIRKIAFLLNKSEMNLLVESSLVTKGVEKHIVKAVPKGAKYQIEFSADELECLRDSVAFCADHEKFKKKAIKWRNLFYKLVMFYLLVLGLKVQKNGPGVPIETACKKEASKLISRKKFFQYYIFNVWIEPSFLYKSGKKIFREIGISADESLYKLAEMITRAFNFYFDHAFGFYDNFKNVRNSKKAYELLFDMGEEAFNPETKGVKKTKIQEVFKKVGNKMLFLFDYGDEWHFGVELKRIRQEKNAKAKPVILKKTGKAPKQYPSW